MRPSDAMTEFSFTGAKTDHCRLPAFDEEDLDSISDPCGICLTFTHHVGCAVEIAGRRFARDVETGCVSVAGPEPIRWLRVREPSDVLQVTASPDLRCSLAEEMGVPGAADLGDLHGGTDPVVWAIAVRLRAALRGGTALDVLEYQFLVRHLYQRIFETRFGGKSPVKGNGGLDPQRLSRVVEFIETELDSDLTIASLAEIAALSPFHFLRSFKRSAGMTPHQYVRARRMEAIRHAIEGGSDPQSAARNLGFGHRRHFQRVYLQHHGVSSKERDGKHFPR
jgi:AraC family transcriptional regulator